MTPITTGKQDAAPSSETSKPSPDRPSDDLMGLPVEPTGLEGAAFQSRVPFDKMTQVEAACFPDLVSPQNSQKMFVGIRNRLLQMWLENPKQQLTAKDAFKRVDAPYNSDEGLVTRYKIRLLLGISRRGVSGQVYGSCIICHANWVNIMYPWSIL